MRMVVVLPAPFGPRKPRISPFWTSKVTSLMATCGPYAFVRCSTWIIEAPGVAYKTKTDDTSIRLLRATANANGGRLKKPEHQLRIIALNVGKEKVAGGCYVDRRVGGRYDGANRRGKVSK